MSSALAQTASGLIVPTSAEVHGRGRVFKCLTCGREYSQDHQERWARHVRQCSERHQPEMEAVIAEHKANPLANPSDPERFQAAKEGRT
jgi:hypothetical protein